MAAGCEQKTFWYPLPLHYQGHFLPSLLWNGSKHWGKYDVGNHWSKNKTIWWHNDSKDSEILQSVSVPITEKKPDFLCKIVWQMHELLLSNTQSSSYWTLIISSPSSHYDCQSGVKLHCCRRQGCTRLSWDRLDWAEGCWSGLDR